MSALTNNNRTKHSKVVNALMNLSGEDLNTHKLISPMRSWPWGRLGQRLGSTRSADGVVVDLPDAVAPDGKKMVAKFIFTTSFRQVQAVQREYKLGKMMATAGIGPKHYGFYEIYQDENKASGNFINYGNFVRTKGHVSNNLFSWGENLSDFGNAYIIVMENLYKAPGLVGAYTVRECMSSNLPIPTRQLERAVKKMHELGIVHGDMHPGNIMVQYIKKPYRIPSTRVVIIDFGRSILANRPLKSMKNANEFAKVGRTQGVGQEAHWWYNPNRNAILLNGNAWKYYSKPGFRLPAFLRRK